MGPSNALPEIDLILALEPEELGLRLLPLLAQRDRYWEFSEFMNVMLGDSRTETPGKLAFAAEQRQSLEAALSEAWGWLEGAALLVRARYRTGVDQWPPGRRTLSRKARRLAEEPDAQRLLSVRRIAKEQLHPAIREDVWALFHRGEYDTAVFVAMKAVEVKVREAARLPARDVGTSLMRTAFHPDSGPLTDMSSEKAEREARVNLFAGAIGSYKNPHSHRNVTLDDPDEVAEILMLANHLLRIIDDRATANAANSTP